MTHRKNFHELTTSDKSNGLVGPNVCASNPDCENAKAEIRRLKLAVKLVRKELPELEIVTSELAAPAVPTAKTPSHSLTKSPKPMVCPSL
jgi:hypothetical protein